MEASHLLLLSVVLFLYICVLGISDKPSGLIHDDPLGGVTIFSVLLLMNSAAASCSTFSGHGGLWRRCRTLRCGGSELRKAIFSLIQPPVGARHTHVGVLFGSDALRHVFIQERPEHEREFGLLVLKYLLIVRVSIAERKDL